MTVDLGHNDPPRAADFAAQLGRSPGPAAGGSLHRQRAQWVQPGQPTAIPHPRRCVGAGCLPGAGPGLQRAMHQRTPSVPLVGPGTFDVAWIRAFAAARLPQTRALTQHWYPLWACAGQNPAATPTAATCSTRPCHGIPRSLSVRLWHRLGPPAWRCDEGTGPTSCAGTDPHLATPCPHALDGGVPPAPSGPGRATDRAAFQSGPVPGWGADEPAVPPECSRRLARSAAGRRGVARGGVCRPGAARLVRASAGVRAQIGAVLAYAVAGPSGTDVVVVDLRDPATLTARPLVVTGLPGQRVVAASRLSRAGKGAADAGTSPSVLVPLAPATPAVVGPTLPESATLVRFAANPG